MTIRKKVIFFFLLLLFSFLVFHMWNAMRADERSAEGMIVLADLFERISEAQLNIIEAGGLAGKIYLSPKEASRIEAEVERLRQEFVDGGHRIANFSLSRGTEQVGRFVEHGSRFYQELKGLLPLKKKMMETCVSSDGILKPVYEIIQERRLIHYKFVNQLAANVRKGERFFEAGEYSKCSFSPWVDAHAQTLDPVLQKMLRAVEPLHQELHDIAAKADQLVVEGQGESAKKMMDRAFVTLSLLDGRLHDITEYADEKYRKALSDFLAQKEKTMGLHGETLEILFGWKAYLKNTVLPDAESAMHSSFAWSRLLLVVVAVLAILLALAICFLTARKTALSFRATQESNETIRSSLEKQQQLIYNLEQEIERRKNVEAELQAANQELEDMAVTDGLTGLYNHRFMKQFLHMEHNRAIRHQHDLSVIMIDIDFFKKVNDAYGHGCGDVVLLGIGEILQQRVRSTDMIARFDVDQAVVARYGGEEMAIILPETPLEGAVGLAEDLRRMIENYTFHCEEVQMNVTVSIGVAASTKAKDETWSALLGRADAALYRAKNGGRNRVEQIV
ncbi:MAG: hypothetical protein BM485_06575 [Desulfobulbaceae bacterium DB1]|nr:MAG: hypothetical protein BM485_06575 [Desulfobulbaceae bacterium DB1]